MAESTKDPLDLLAHAARHHAKDPSTQTQLDVQVSRALLAANGMAARRERVRVWTGYAVAAAVLLAFVGREVWRSSAEPERESMQAAQAPAAITRSVLATGDVVSALAGSELDMSAFRQTERHVRVASGTVLFDVVHLPSDVPFVVETADAEVHVRGTVFSVGVVHGVTQVEVFEGRVDLVRADGVHSLAAGQRLTSTPASDRLAWVSPLAEAGMAAARARAARALTARADVVAPTHAEASSAPLAPATNGTVVPRANVLVARVESSVATGDFEGARSGCEHVDAANGPWLLACADAQRGLGEFAAAARMYEQASLRLSPSRATLAGVSAARVYLDRLHDANAALRVIALSRADESGSPVEEPAFVLRLRALDSLNRHDEAARLASVYLARFPDGSARAWAESLTTRATSAPRE